MDLEGACLAQHAHERPLGVAAHDGIIDHDQPLALDHPAQRVEFESDTQLPDRLRRLDEGPPHVGVLDQALTERNARLLGVADGRVTT
jgi:hypothetical protein